MAKVQAIMKQAGKKYSGYYGDRRVPVGEVFEMHNVNADGIYIDKNGKPILFDPKTGKPSKDGEPRKCSWVAKVGSLKDKDKKVDPKEVAAVLSGKYPGQAKPFDKKEE